MHGRDMGSRLMIPVGLLVVCLAAWVPAAAAQQGRLPWSSWARPTNPNCTGQATDPCTITAGVQVLVSSSITVRSLTIYGDLLIQPKGPPPTRFRRQPPIKGPSNLVVTTAFILVKGTAARLAVNGTTWSSKVTIFLQRNPNAYDDLPGPGSQEDTMLGGGRVLAAWQGAQVQLDGYPLQRTWTLLTQDVFAGNTTICVSDNVVGDWPVGSNIAIAPSDNVYNIWPTSLAVRVGAQTFKIVNMSSAINTPCCRSALPSSCSGSMITLNGAIQKTPQTQGAPGAYNDVPTYHGSSPPVQAEVLMLDRTVTVTGNDFTPRYKPSPPPPWPNPAVPSGQWPTPWSQWADSPFPTEGLHVLAVGLCQNGSANGADCTSNGGFLKARYVRVEKGGQRGWIGRYPLHFHKMGDCPACEFIGNAVVNSTQRGIVIHSTHNSKVVRNVVFAARGAHLYVEEGTEVNNTIQENALVCEVGIASYTKFVNGVWIDAGKVDNSSQGKSHGGGGCQDDSRFDFGDPSTILGGCRIQGTDNEQSDCAQQAGIWALSTTNNFIGNRVSNHYNGIYFQSTLFKDGRLGTDSLKRVCPIHSNWGTMRGNVVHSNQRFGWYPDVNYPNAVKRGVDTNGYVSDISDICTGNLTNFQPGAVCSCRPYSLPVGASNAQPAVVYEDGLDWGNGFVGQYDLADVQYQNFSSINNNIGMYWKGSKNFRTVGTSLIKDAVFQFQTRARYSQACCPTPNQPCGPSYSAYLLADWLAAGAAAVSLVQLPGASATMIMENVMLRGSPGIADWLTSGVRNGGQGAALAINQQCKFFRSLTNPLGDLGYDEGALCTPQVYLVNVTFDIYECKQELGQSQAQLPVWVNIGAANGNSYLGMVVAADDSLCGGLLKPCPIRAVVSNYSTHLLGLPGNPCVMPSLVNTTNATFGPDWYRRFNGHMICTQQTRRFNIWGPDQGTLLLMPPNGTQAWEMDWLGFGIPGNCWGTNCSVDEERRWAEGYGATVLSNEVLPGTWTLKRKNMNDGKGEVVDLTKVRMIEFSDEVFGIRFAPDTMNLQIQAQQQVETCTLSSTDGRAWMTQFGPVQRGGGSCTRILDRYPMSP